MRFVLGLTAVLVASTAAARQTAPAITAASRSMQPGEALVLTITPPSPAEAVIVHVFDRDVPAFQVDGQRWRAIVGIDLGAPAGPFTAAARSGTSATPFASGAWTIRPKTFQTRKLTVDPDFVTPPADVEDRIVREAAELERLLNQVTPTRLWDGPFMPPVRAAANSAFGSRSVFNGVSRNPHAGADFPSATGTAIAAPNAGRVVLATNLYFSGNTVIIDHGLGMLSLLAHLSKIDVAQGDLVKVGSVIGKVGATGRVTGPHLHWAMRLGGARVDPLSVLSQLGKTPTR